MNENSNKTEQNEVYSLNDDRRVKVLSPGMLVVKRFLRNGTAVTGLIILTFMFLFSFLGGLLSPYEEDELFYRDEIQEKTYASASRNDEFRFAVAEDQDFGAVLQAKLVLAINSKKDSFVYQDVEYLVEQEGDSFYTVSSTDGALVALAAKDVISTSSADESLSFALRLEALRAISAKSDSFTVDGQAYTLDEDGILYRDGQEIAFISRYAVNPAMSDVFLSREFKELVSSAIEAGESSFTYPGEDGTPGEYKVTFNPDKNMWNVTRGTSTRVFDRYARPSAQHWFGTDRNGMDMLTRLMYGGRVSLVIGFIVELIATVLGILMGGIAGYFGKWVDNLIMRIVDVFYCIPSMPIIIILGAAMDATGVDPSIRMIYLMLILGFLGWPGIARMVRGQILSLREQEFMTATEACGISVSRRILRHLVPNVIPQIIVSCTMGLGSTIITEATLSFLGLGVKFPFASWGNIINDVNDVYVLTNYWFIWIPAGSLLLLTVLAFNLVGDGLRDAFDPRMKR